MSLCVNCWVLIAGCVNCKHFFGIFSANVEWSFNSSPVTYKNSVFITLDNEHIKINNGNADANIVDRGNIKDDKDVDLLKNLYSSPPLSSDSNPKESNSPSLSEENPPHQDNQVTESSPRET